MFKIFDSHFHIIDPVFPLKDNNGFIPDAYTPAQYKNELQKLNIKDLGGAVVASSFQGYHQEYFKAAFKELGRNFVGITQIKSSISDAELKQLNNMGIRGIRFNIFRGVKISNEEIKTLAERVYKLFGWSTEFYLDLAKADTETLKLITSLPKASVDHLGMMRAVDRLKLLLANGVAVRVTGFGRVQYSRKELLTLLPNLYKENPDALIFGTDLPSTRAKRHFSADDILLIKKAFADNKEVLDKIFYKNGLN